MPNGRRALVRDAEQRVLAAADKWARSRPWEQSGRRQTAAERELYEATFLLSKTRHITGNIRVAEDDEPDTEPG